MAEWGLSLTSRFSFQFLRHNRRPCPHLKHPQPFREGGWAEHSFSLLTQVFRVSLHSQLSLSPPCKHSLLWQLLRLSGVTTDVTDMVPRRWLHACRF